MPAPKPTEVQTLICFKEQFKSVDAAKSWLAEHDFKAPAVDETEDSYRFRQAEPGEFTEGSFRTIVLDTGVKAVIGKRKTEMGGLRRGRLVSMDGAIPKPGEVRTGVWDRFTTAGPSVKGGDLTEFTAETLGQFVENFVARGLLLPMDANHQSNFTHVNGQPAPSLARYSALAVVMGGKVVAFGAIPGKTVSPPDPAGMGDGLYGFRCEVTPLGQQILPNLRYLSPTFTPDGEDEQGQAIGYALHCVAATDVPFQGDRGDGAPEITFSRGQDRTMAVSPDVVAVGDWIRVNSEWFKVKATAPRDGAMVSASNGRGFFIEWNNIDEVSKTKPRLMDSTQASLLTCPHCGQVLADIDYDGKLPAHVGRDGKPCEGSEQPPVEPMLVMAKDMNGESLSVGDKAGYYQNIVTVESLNSGGYVMVKFHNGSRREVRESELLKFDAALGGASNPTGASRATDQGARKMARKFSESVSKRLGLMEEDDDTKIQAAFAKRMDGARKMFEEEPDEKDPKPFAKRFEDEATALEEDAQAYEDAQFAAEEGKEPASVVMRRMARQFRRLSKMDVDPNNAAQNAAIHIKTGAEHSEAGSISEPGQPAHSAQMQVMEATNKALQTRLAKLEATEAQRTAAVEAENTRRFEALADAAIAGGYAKESRGALITFARQDFTAAHAAVKHLLPKSGAPAHLFERLTAVGGPIGYNGEGAARDVGDPKPKTVKTPFGGMVAPDEAFANEIKRVAMAKDPILMERVNSHVSVISDRDNPAARLIAAEKVVRMDRPDLAVYADENE